MRPYVLLGILMMGVVPAHGQPLPAWAQQHALPAAPGAIDLSPPTSFAARRRVLGDTDVLLHHMTTGRLSFGSSLLPSVHIGPLEASLGGSIGSDDDVGPPTWGSRERRVQRAGAELSLQSQPMLGGHFSGSITTRSAKLTFTLPLQ